jgi:hypothetical protein
MARGAKEGDKETRREGEKERRRGEGDLLLSQF